MFVERKDYNNVISVKLVIPGGCNARCNFCYMKSYRKNSITNSKHFLKRFIPSLDSLLKSIGNKNPVSLDITGNEPTLHPAFLKLVLLKLKEYRIKDKVERVTMTTNGSNLLEVIPYLQGVVDYVNISVHDFKQEDRYRKTGLNYPDYYYKELVLRLKEIGITTSAIAVLYEHINCFRIWCYKFILWCKHQGFISLRFRCNVFEDVTWNGKIFDAYMNEIMEDDGFQVLVHENTTDSHWCRLRMEDKFRVFFLHGVLDTSQNTKGIEYIISNNGKVYCDFYKRTPIEKYEYEIGKIYDKVRKENEL